MYLFFNAGVQGSFKILSTAYKSRKAVKFLGGAVMLGFIILSSTECSQTKTTVKCPLGSNQSFDKTHNLHFFLPTFGEKHANTHSIRYQSVHISGTLLESVIFGKMKLGDAANTWVATAIEFPVQ